MSRGSGRRRFLARMPAVCALPLLAGPFTVEKWERGQYVAMRRNPHALSPRVKPRVDRITWRIIPSTQALEAALLSGDVDAVSPVGLALDQALELQRFHRSEPLGNLQHPLLVRRFLDRAGCRPLHSSDPLELVPS